MEAKDIKKQTQSWYPVPITTTEMIERFRSKLDELDVSSNLLLCKQTRKFGNWWVADRSMTPFYIRFCDKTRPSDRRAAYLWIANGQPEWRYAVEDTGIDTCSVVYHAPLTKKLDGIFKQHYRAIQQQTKLPAIKMPDAVPIAERMAWVGTTFLCGSQPTGGDLLWQFDMVFTVQELDSCRGIVEDCGLTLAADAGKLYAREVGPWIYRERVIALHFGLQTRFLDIEHPGNPAVNVLLCTNQLLYPHYEIRKYRGLCCSESAYCITLAVHEWCALESRYGESAVYAVFEPISVDTVLPVIDPKGSYHEKGGAP